MRKLKRLLPVIFALLLLAGTGFCIYKYCSASAEAKEYTESIAELKKASIVQSKTGSGEITADVEQIDHAALKEQNSDYLCWLSIPDTNIDYPLCAYKEGEPDYYLNFDFYGRKSKFGTPFLDERCNLDTSDVLFIYGHHNNYGTAFSQLHGYKNKEFWENHKTVILDTEDGEREYTVFAAILATGSYTEDDQSIFECLSMSQQEFDDMLQHVANKALYSTELSPKYGDRLLALVTCEYSQENGRLVVLAKEN